MPGKSTGKVSGQDSGTKATSSDNKAGGFEPLVGKASPPTKGWDLIADACKSTGSEKAKLQPASSHEAAAVPVNERRKPSRFSMCSRCLGVCVPTINCWLMVTTTSGRLVGTTVSTGEGVNVTGWLGVPYARASEDQRRFAKPIPLNSSDNCEKVLAAQPRAPCAQWVNGRVLGSEDCLHLNVWAPIKPTTLDNRTTLDITIDNGTTLGNGTMPLLLAATGHWFQKSTNNVPQWADLAAKVGAVVVAPNVRLGVLGFLHSRIMQGLTPDVAEEDMMVAVEWALENAAAFGADPSALMLVGNGSGAYMLVQAAGRLNVSVARAVIEGSVTDNVHVEKWLADYERPSKTNRWDPTLMLANISYYLSGTASVWFDTHEEELTSWDGPMDPSKELANKLGCDLKDKSKWLNCFSDAKLDALLGAAAKMDLRFAPLWDPMFLTIGPHGKKLPDIKEVVAGADVEQAATIEKAPEVRTRQYNRLMPPSSYGDVQALVANDLRETIRAVVREELQKMFPRSQPPVDSIADIVREELQHSLGVAAPLQPQPEAMSYAAAARRNTTPPHPGPSRSSTATTPMPSEGIQRLFLVVIAGPANAPG
ncbi:uncharacterized protein LOC119406647 [Rhipicephalus sanguineus]|uniref:uncharacterized protein LOC119406647 n=1 Tax=Rhipicephalus sanguineus TaxID=34632 RepID=UPI0020C426B1|nr:uncharacterized protein LOC119406647 [Rhipicephalus sanguineus]